MKYCCKMMQLKLEQTCEKHGGDCVDIVMAHLKDGRYGIPIHDGGSSLIVVNFCPWCGAGVHGTMSDEPKGQFRKAAERAALYAEMEQMFCHNALEGLQARLEAMHPLDAARAALVIYRRLERAYDEDPDPEDTASRFSSWIGKLSRERTQ